MKQVVNVIVSALISLVISYVCSFAQTGHGTFVRQIGGPGQIQGEPFNLGEIGSVIIKDSSGLHVLMVSPPDRRPKGYQDVDLRQGDLILMLNGKRVTTTEELTKAYDSAKIGDKLQLGVKRDDQMMVVSFAKADPATLPQRRMMVMKTGDGKGGSDIQLNGKALKIPEGVTDPEVIPGLGIMIGTKQGKPVIAAILPFMKDRPELASLKPLDELVSVGGKSVASVSDVLSAYHTLKTGEKFAFKVMQGSQEHEISIDKPEDSGVRVIEKK